MLIYPLAGREWITNAHLTFYDIDIVCVTNLGWYGQFHTKSSVWLHGQLLLLKPLVRSLPATLYTFYTILNMLSEWFKPTRSGSMVLSGHGKWLCSYIPRQLGSRTSVAGLWSGAGLARNMDIFSNPPKVHGRVLWANPITISHFLCLFPLVLGRRTAGVGIGDNTHHRALLSVQMAVLPLRRVSEYPSVIT